MHLLIFSVYFLGNKVSSGIGSPRVGSFGSDESLRSQYKRALSRISVSKVSRIRQIFDELTRQSSTSGERVDKASFLRYFPLPGMMGERLFSVFDGDGNGSIDFPEFLTGLTMIYHGTVEDKKKFLFRMYDLDGNGEVTKDELFTMLSYIPAAFRMLDLNDLEDKTALSAVMTQPPSPELEQRIRTIVDSVFSGKKEGETLSFDEFQSAVSRNSAISEIINIFYDDALPENELAIETADPRLDGSARKASSLFGNGSVSRSNSEAVAIISPKLRSKCPLCEAVIQFAHCFSCGCKLKANGTCNSCGLKLPETRFCFSCGHPLKSTLDQREDESSSDESSSAVSGVMAQEIAHSEITAQDADISGFLSKIGRTTQIKRSRFFILKDCFLYYYSNDSVEALQAPPKGVVFLSGVVVSPMSPSGKFGFVIKSGTKKRMFFCEEKEDQEKWVSALLRASRTRLISDFFQLDLNSPPIGRGKFSVVYAGARKGTNEEVAVKVLDTAALEAHAEDREFIRTELAIVKLVSHPNIVKTIDVFEALDKIYIVMERVRGGDLLSKLQRTGRFSEFEAKRTIKALTHAILYLQGKNVIHRDLKPENVLLTEEGVVKITDFGLSALVPHSRTLDAPLGTVAYAAPEVLLSLPYDKSVDLWGLGALTYVLLAGRMPFGGNTDKEVAGNVLRAKFSFSNSRVWDGVSLACKDFISKLLVKDPARRMTALEALRHEWLASLDTH